MPGARHGEDVDDDRILVARMRAGEERAFNEFFDLYFHAVYRFALSRLGREAELAKEVAQATICKGLEKLHLYRGEAQLFTWLCAICRFEISAHHRRDRRFATEDGSRLESELDDAAEKVVSPGDDPERQLLRDELSSLVRRTVDELPPRYAQALAWKYTDGLPVNEIARRLGLSAKAAESLLTRAREAFKARFPRRARAIEPAGPTS
jgi:RNA polymerase sigma-70 factor (ECF subfamily)